MKFTCSKWLKTHLNCPQSLEKNLKFTCTKGHDIYNVYPGRGFVDKTEKYAKKFHDPEKYAKKFHDPENFSYKIILYIIYKFSKLPILDLLFLIKKIADKPKKYGILK